jgi:RecJ-like exonuclease
MPLRDLHPALEPCSVCKGRGNKPHTSRPTRCHNCAGQGIILMPASTILVCRVCRGQGWEIETPCELCGGWVTAVITDPHEEARAKQTWDWRRARESKPPPRTRQPYPMPQYEHHFPHHH